MWLGGGQAGNIGRKGWEAGGWGTGGGYIQVEAHCILSLHVDSAQEGGWSLESEREREWVGI